VQFELKDSGDLKRLVKALKQVEDGKVLKKELTDGLRGVLRPLVPQVRAAYTGGPVRSRRRRTDGAPVHRPGDLRGHLARATRLEVRTAGKLAGARIRVDGRRMPSGMGALPKSYEGEKPWRHPVFGNPDVWVGQRPTPTFYPAVRPSEAEAVAKINAVVAGIFAKIERST
jgi:hypothetical protein